MTHTNRQTDLQTIDKQTGNQPDRIHEFNFLEICSKICSEICVSVAVTRSYNLKLNEIDSFIIFIK
jgi:hypothetical protein